MNNFEKLRLMRDLGGWKYPMLRIEDKLFGSHKAEPYLYEYVKKADESKYPEMLKAMYKLSMGETLNLDNPKSFSEKIQWLKLYDSTPLKTRLADKYLVRDWVAEKIGEEYLVPLLGVWDSFDEIGFDALPNQFVLKCNHGSGMNAIIKDKSTIDKAALKKQFDEWMETDFSALYFEMHYRSIPRKIIAEKYMEDKATSELRDYKFYCFNGNPKYCQVISDRGSDESIDFFDMQWTLQPFTGLGAPGHPFPHSRSTIPRPETIAEMIRAATLLSTGFPFVRVDFYEIQGRMYFGELTFTPAGGFGVFEPEEWNTILGSWLELPENVK